ncbi:polysaccharide deacetylase family protein [Sphingomonas gilva]|uniref:polysaccharide deacetylase family protein n=1 Tax=Sphingomonas gilva TaxID=2305907 RepID=UPI001FE94BBE|nr:polysaccharide deacetylase family protein [Sphingomonas gilva]
MRAAAFWLAALWAVFALAAPAAAQKRIALSFDDVPRHAGAFLTPDERTERLIAGLKEGGVDQAAFFVTPGNLEKPDGEGGEARIDAYVRAGHVIANHSYSHKWLSRTPAADYIADIDRAAAWLKGRAGYRPWYRFPFLDEGRGDLAKRAEVRAALAQRGLANGYVTVDNYDWHLDALANEAKREGREMDMAALRDLYVETLVGAANFYDRIAREALGRQPAQVLLLHETDLNAMYIADVVAGLRKDGWEIVTIDEAYRDPIAAREPDGWFTNGGRVAALAQDAGGAPKDLIDPRTDEDVLTALFQARVLKDKR